MGRSLDAVKALIDDYRSVIAVAFGRSAIGPGVVASRVDPVRTSKPCVTGIATQHFQTREALRFEVAQFHRFLVKGALPDRGAHHATRIFSTSAISSRDDQVELNPLPKAEEITRACSTSRARRRRRLFLCGSSDGVFRHQPHPGARRAAGVRGPHPRRPLVPAPCQVACPIGTCAAYIAHIWDEDYEGAFEAITSTNPFSSICGRVCDAPCEPACRRVDSDGAVQIVHWNLKRFVMDKLGATWRPPAAPVTRSRSIGIVGAGPAGLVAAHDLCVAGYSVHVYEMTDRLGGMMIWGIPAFRLPPGIIDEDVDRLMQRCPGLEVHLDTALGRDVSLGELKERHDAVLLTIGAWWGKPMGIRGEEDERVVDGAGFLRRVNAGERPEMPETVVVVGGGDVAMDACRVAKRLPGCKHVKVIYRRAPGEIPAREIELHHARQGGRRVPLPHPAGCRDPARQPARVQHA